MSKKTVRWITAVIASLISMGLSWPYFRDFEYWAESPTAWAIYFGVGFVMAVYVFYVFIDCLETLFRHDALGKQDAGEKQPEDAA